MFRRITGVMIAAVALLAAVSVHAAAPTPAYQRQARKARGFFEAREWLNATAMYTLMLEEQPAVSDTYAHAIVARYFEADTTYAISLIQRAMNHGVALDSLLADVKTASFEAGSANMYEDILLHARAVYPYMARSINARLTDYYDFRGNAPQLIAMSRHMLSASPGNLRYRRLLARGYMLDGAPQQAAGIWRQILSVYPDQLDTLLDLGSLYWLSGERDLALPLLARAYSISPSPYLESLLR